MMPAPNERPDASLNPDLQQNLSEMPQEHDASAPLATVSVEEDHRSFWPVAWAVVVTLSILATLYFLL